MVKKVPAPKQQGDTPGKGTLHAFFSSATPTKRERAVEEEQEWHAAMLMAPDQVALVT